jgi:hypothetical protein
MKGIETRRVEGRQESGRPERTEKQATRREVPTRQLRPEIALGSRRFALPVLRRTAGVYVGAGGPSHSVYPLQPRFVVYDPAFKHLYFASKVTTEIEGLATPILSSVPLFFPFLVL